MPLNNPSFSKTLTSSETIPYSIPSSTTSLQFLEANPSRIGATIWNNSANVLYLDLSEAASPTSYTVKILSDGYYELPFKYTGKVSGAWQAADGNALVREFI